MNVSELLEEDPSLSFWLGLFPGWLYRWSRTKGGKRGAGKPNSLLKISSTFPLLMSLFNAYRAACEGLSEGLPSPGKVHGWDWVIWGCVEFEDCIWHCIFHGLLMQVIIFPVLELYLTDAAKILLSQLAMSSDGSAAGGLVYLFLMKYGVCLSCMLWPSARWETLFFSKRAGPFRADWSNCLFGRHTIAYT